jgi:hypothetical protein
MSKHQLDLQSEVSQDGSTLIIVQRFPRGLGGERLLEALDSPALTILRGHRGRDFKPLFEQTGHQIHPDCSFGDSFDLSKNGRTVVIGCPTYYDDQRKALTGAVEIFMEVPQPDGSGPQFLRFRLLPPTEACRNEFGRYVEVAQNGQHLTVMGRQRGQSYSYTYYPDHGWYENYRPHRLVS